MNTLKTILVAVDFSTGSRSALEHAARLAGLNGAKLHLLHVLDSSVLAILAEAREENYERYAKTAFEAANNSLKRWAAQSGVAASYETIIATGTPLHEILEHIQTLNADLVVAGIAGDGDASAGAGSLPTKLAQKAAVPVLLVRPHHSQAFGKVIACIDFSQTSREAARHAHRVAVQDGAQVHFLHVLRESLGITVYGGTMAEGEYPLMVFTPQERQAYIQRLRQQLHEFVRAEAEDIQCAEMIHEATSCAAGIAEQARDWGADLLIVGAKGRTNLSYFLLGSTAERLLRLAPCSLLVVKEAV